MNVTQGACTAVSGCLWDADISACVANQGFVFEYGTVAQGNDKVTPSCALDVSGDTVVTTACLQQQQLARCKRTTASWGAGTDPANGTLLPLVTTPPAISGYPNDPCVGIHKHLSIQATCGISP